MVSKIILASSRELIPIVMTESISAAIAHGLDDYTTDQRGDIGSLVRIEAIDAVHASWEQGQLPNRALQDLGSKVCRLALEKLDRVRVKAWHCLHDIWKDLSEGQTLFKYVYQMSMDLISDLVQWLHRRV